MSRHSARGRRYNQLRAAFLAVYTVCWICTQLSDMKLSVDATVAVHRG
jgi:hypothetical protein